MNMIGRTISHFEVLEKLGEGGMGVVYKARDTQLDRLVALKVLPPDRVLDNERRRRFGQEARSASALNHPNIVTIYEIASADGMDFIVMEFVEGQTLEQLIGRKGLPVDVTVRYATQVADALAKAHAAGIVHRDLKPANVMVTGDGLVKVLDFGLAKLMEPISTDDLDRTMAPEAHGPLTEAGAVVGTVAYMSPEQAEGRKVDARSDIFALGSLLYEAVTGRRAFQRPSAAQTLLAILTDDPPAASTTSKQIPWELDRVIAHCLEKDPRNRFQSARDVGFALQSVLSTSKTATVSPVRRSRAIDSLAVLPFANAGNDPNADYLCDGMAEGIINSLSKLPKLRVVPRSRAFRYKGRESEPRVIGRELNVRALLMGKVLLHGDLLQVQTELVDVAEEKQLWGERFNRKFSDIFAVQEEITDQISDQLRLKLTAPEKKRLTKRHTQDTEAYRLFLKGRYHWNKRSPENLKKSMEYFQQAIALDNGFAPAYSGLADCYALICTLSVMPPRESFGRVKAAALKALDLDSKLAEPHISLAYAKAFHDWDWKGAQMEIREGIALNPDYPTGHLWYALILSALGQSEEAIVEAKKAQDLDALSTAIGTGRGWSYYYARRYDDAIEQCEKTLDLDPQCGIAFYYMGLAYQQKGASEQAIGALEKAVTYLDGNPTALSGLGNACASFGRGEEAQKLLDRLHELSAKRYVAPLELVQVYAGLGEIDHAFEWLEKAYEERSMWLVFLRSEPRSDAFRSDPRFQNMLLRLGLAK